MMDNIKNLQRFPAVIAGIYFLYNEDNLVYIGRTENLFQRIGTHIHGNKDFDSFSFLEVRSRDLEKVEYDLIDFFNPPLNVSKPVLRVNDDQISKVNLWATRIVHSKYENWSSFCDAVDIPQPMLSQYVSGKLRPRIDHFEKVESILKELGV